MEGGGLRVRWRAPGGRRQRMRGGVEVAKSRRGAEEQVRIEPAWREVLNAVLENPGHGRVAVLGSTGSGKSTLASWLGRELARSEPTGRLDADPGQARVGPPGTIGLGREPGAADAPLALRFVGASSPARHLLGMAVGVERLARRAVELGLRRLVLDPPGFLDFAAGHWFHFHLIELLDPDHLVILDGASLDPVLQPLRRRHRPMIHEVAPSSAVVERSKAERRRYRARRHEAALKGARARLVPPHVPVHGRIPEEEREWKGLLVGLLDREGFLLRLGVAQEASRGRLRVRAKPVPWGEVASVEVGSGRVDV